MGALDAIAATLRNLRAAAQDSARAGKVGQAFMDASKRPEYWDRGPSFADHLQGLHNQFGTEGQMPTAPYDYAVGLPGQAEGIQGHVYSQLSTVGGKFPGDDLRPWMASGALPEDAKYHILDSLDLAKGSGAGQKIYPTVLGNIRNDPEAYNIVEGLSTANKTRRNYLQSAAIQRDPEMARRMLVAPGQLQATVGKGQAYDPAYVAAWQRQSPEQQVGALQMMALANTLEQMQRTGSAPAAAKFLENPYDNAALTDMMRRWGAEPASLPVAGGGPGKEPKLPFGVRSAKRAATALGALEDRGPAPAWATRGVEYRGGGSVG